MCLLPRDSLLDLPDPKLVGSAFCRKKRCLFQYLVHPVHHVGHYCSSYHMRPGTTIVAKAAQSVLRPDSTTVYDLSKPRHLLTTDLQSLALATPPAGGFEDVSVRDYFKMPAAVLLEAVFHEKRMRAKATSRGCVQK